MAKNQIIDIDLEFEGVELDESDIKQETRKAKISLARTGAGSGMTGKKHSAESRVKIGNCSSKRTHTEDTKNKISQAKSGKTHSSEHSAKLSAALIGSSRAARPIITPYGIFKSRNEAIENLKNNIRNLARLIDKSTKIEDSGWKYISKEEYIMLTGKEL